MKTAVGAGEYPEDDDDDEEEDRHEERANEPLDRSLRGYIGRQRIRRRRRQR